MDSPSSGPPNPREARYQHLPVRRGAAHPITIILITICILVAVLSTLGSNVEPVAWMFFNEPQHSEIEAQLIALEEAGQVESDTYDQLLDDYIKETEKHTATSQITHGEVWRIITPIFLHFGVIHLAFNMLWLWTLGRMLEPALGRTRFLYFILIIAAASNTAEALIGGTYFGGMSGVIYGLFGFVVVLSKLQPTPGVYLDPRTVRFMLIWLVLCFTGLLGPIANWAHSFGLASGAAIGGIHALRHGGLNRIRRRHQFYRAIQESESLALHRCAVCQRTENDDRDLEFRVGTNGLEYCLDHLPDENSH